MSDLTRDVLKDFADIVIDESNKDEEVTAYGTTVESDGVDYVKLDGSSLLTPITTTTDIKPGERVLVLIKNHQAVIIGNSSNPSAGSQELNNLKETVNLDKATIKDLVANNVTINDSLKANSARIDSLEATNVEINGKLMADRADITRLDTDKLNADEADIRYAKVDELRATSADVVKLNADYAKFKDASVKRLDANEASIQDLDAKKLSAEAADIKYLTIDNAKATYLQAGDFNAYKATVETLLAAKANIEELEANYLKVANAEATYAKITELDTLTGNFNTLNADLAKVEELVAKKASIEDLNAAKASIQTLQTDLTTVNQLIAKKVDAEYVKTQITESTKTITDDLTAIHAIVDVLDTKYATIEQLNAAKANLETLIAKKATIEDLNAAKATIGELNGLVANINSILSGSIGTGTLQTIHLTAENVVIDDAIIKSANIEGLDVSKLNAGTISTNKFAIKSDDGGIVISGSTQQFKDKNNKVRLQIGKDAQGNFNFIVFGEDGTTAIYNQNGITKQAVPDGLIVDQMVSDTANIQAKKIQYIDKDGNKTLQTYLTTEQGKIESLIKETTIENGDGTTTSLKDRYLETEATVEGVKTEIADIKTTSDSMDSRIANVEATAEGIKTTVSKIRVGTRNLIYNTDFSIDQTSNWKTFNANATISSNSGYMKVVQTAANSGCYAKYAKGFEKDKDYVVSFVAYASEQCSLTYNYIMSSNTSTVGNQPLGSGVSISTEPTLYVIKFTANNDFPENSSIMLGANKAVTWYFKEMMCEEGTINSSWTVAPEDVDSAISDVDTKANTAKNTADTAKTTATNAQTISQQTASKFSWIVKSGSSATDFTLTDRTAQLVANNINLNGLVTFKGLDSSTQNKINDANNKIDNLQVGGRNLLVGSELGIISNQLLYGSTASKYNDVTLDGNPLYNMSGPHYIKINFPTLKVGEQYIFSCDVARQSGGTSQDVFISIGELTAKVGIASGGIWTNFNVMFTASDASTYALVRINNVSSSGSGNWIGHTRHFKLEIGNKATDWTPAPEDKANQSIIDNWAKDSIVNGETVINGGYIKTNTIKTDQLAVDDIFATGSSVMNIINAQEINANRITSGLLSAERINAYGLSILNKTTNQQTFNISNNGEVTIRGSVSSGNYVESKTGWTINNDGTAEFNDIIARGSVITNDGGIVSAGGSGRNLQLNTSFYNGLTSWIKGSNHSVDTGFQYKLTNTVKFERSGLTSDSIQWLYSGSNVIRCTVGKSYTAQANFYTKDSSAIDGSGVIFGIYFYTSDSSSAGTFRKKVSFTNNQWVHETITAVAPQNAVYVAIVVGAYRNGTFWMAQPKLEEGDVATDWSLAPEDKTKQVRFWAGTSFEERESAPWIVYSDGSMEATQGKFSGVFSGTVDIGNIKIADTSSTAGGDALLTIQNGQNGIKRVQLTDSSASRFAQDIIIADDHDADKISLKQDGTAVIGTGINVANNVILNGKSLIMNNNELTTTDDGASYLFKSNVTLGTSVGPANLIVHGSADVNDVTVNEHLYFGSNVKITKVSNGVNIDVIK
mgnify:CR=1 FL=1|jgi:hypothetical protein